MIDIQAMLLHRVEEASAKLTLAVSVTEEKVAVEKVAGLQVWPKTQCVHCGVHPIQGLVKVTCEQCGDMCYSCGITSPPPTLCKHNLLLRKDIPEYTPEVASEQTWEVDAILKHEETSEGIQYWVRWKLDGLTSESWCADMHEGPLLDKYNEELRMNKMKGKRRRGRPTKKKPRKKVVVVSSDDELDNAPLVVA
jgi:hypothetical protein